MTPTKASNSSWRSLYTFPGLDVLFMAIAGPLYLVWFPLLARDFLRLARSK